MLDDLLFIIRAWENLTWLQKRRIDWLRWKSKYSLGHRELVSTTAVVALFVLAVFETHPMHRLTMASTIILLHFYILMFRKLLPN